MCFYPRHPRGWRRFGSVSTEQGFQVSIHATLAGGDRTAERSLAAATFLSTPPSRVATREYVRVELFKTFLSTPPSRVATAALGALKGAGCVSIHATLAGGDRRAGHRDHRQGVSIHATLAGGDVDDLPLERVLDRFLSTPPSRVATASIPTLLETIPRFYPRHPRGWRPLILLYAPYSVLCFYPRHPRGWRPGADRRASSCAKFLSTPPSRVATHPQGRRRCTDRRFYPRHPRGWRQLKPDPSRNWRTFLSTPPSRVATYAYLTGLLVIVEFLSTPPSRVATRR